MISPKVSAAAFTAGSLNGISWAYPLVVDVRPRGAEHDVLHPVGGRPAGGALALEADAPRRAAVGHDLVAERDEVVPGLGHLVAGGVEVVLRVPDHALEVDVGRHAVVLAVVLAERHERLAEQVVRARRCRSPCPRAPRSSPASARSAMAPGWGTAATSRVPPSAWIWNCSSKSPAELDLDVVVGVGVDQLVEDLLVGVGLLGLAGAQQRPRCRCSQPARCRRRRRRRRHRRRRRRRRTPRRRAPARTVGSAVFGISSVSPPVVGLCVSCCVSP